MNRDRIDAILVWLGAAAAALLWLATFAAWAAAGAAGGDCETRPENAAVHVAVGALLAALLLNLVAYPNARAARLQPRRRIAGLALALSVLGLVGVYSAEFFAACWE